MVFALARTFDNPGDSQSGFPSPGSGAQVMGDPSHVNLLGQPIPPEPVRATKGLRSWLGAMIGPGRSQSGFPSPEGPLQYTDRYAQPQRFGGVFRQFTQPYSRGAAAYAPNFGKVLSNPIGAGVAVNHRPQASYGGAAQYENGALWWTSQVIPTSIHLQGLNNADELAAILSQETVYAVVRTTG